MKRDRFAADGIAVARPGQVPFAAIQRNVDEIRTVSEESLSKALLALRGFGLTPRR